MTHRPTFWRELEVKRPPLLDGRATPTRQGHFRKRDVWRKHEAEPVYVANSEPTRWPWSGGRAVVNTQDLISSEPFRGEVGRDTGRWCVLPRETLLFWHQQLPRCYKTETTRGTKALRGQRVADLQIVLMTQGQGNPVMEWRTKPCRPENRMFWASRAQNVESCRRKAKWTPCSGRHRARHEGQKTRQGASESAKGRHRTVHGCEV
jgi:hypothetical protein